MSCPPEDIDSATERLEGCVEEIRQWMKRNNLKLNDNKTEFVVLGSQHQLSSIGERQLTIGSDSITATISARNNGAVFDETMEMKGQVNQITRSCYAHIRAFSHIRKYLTKDATERLVNAFVTSRLDNNNSLLYGIPDYLLDKLQLIQNNAARLIAQKKKSEHISPTLFDLHWLPVKYRIQYKVLLLAFKSQHGKAPVYLADLLEPYLPARSLRSEQQQRLSQPKARTVKYGDRAFSICAPRLWNKLPSEIKEADTVDRFKALLKTHLFRIAYDDLV